MAKKKKKGTRKRKPSLMTLVGIFAGLYGTYVWANAASEPKEKVGRVVESFIGVNPFAPRDSIKFRWYNMYFTLPVVGTQVARKAINYISPQAFRGLPFGA